MYTFSQRTFRGMVQFRIPVPRDEIESSIVLVYYNPAIEPETSWFPVPGLGSYASNYETRFYLTELGPTDYAVGIRLHDPATGNELARSVTWRQTRIFVIPASSNLAREIDSGELDATNFRLVEEMATRDGF